MAGKFSSVSPPKNVIETCGRSPALRSRKSIDWRAVSSDMRALPVPSLPLPAVNRSSPYS
jgi:hypothetical protein